MNRKHSLDFKGIANIAHRGSVFIRVRHTQDMCRKFRRLAVPIDHCTLALFFRTVISVLVTIGILAIMAMVVAVIYQRVSISLSVLRSIND